MGSADRQALRVRFPATPPCGPDAAFSLLELVLVVAVVSVVVAILVPYGSRYLDSGRDEETRTELRDLARAVLCFYEDVERFPESLVELQVDPVHEGWKGPYLSWAFTDGSSGATAFFDDAWGRAYLFSIESPTTARIRSRGRNGVDESGQGDDLQYDVDVSPALRKITIRELRDLNLAVDSFNVSHLPNDPLPTTFPGVLARLQADGYLPSDADSTERFLYDGWGQPYEIWGSMVVLEILSAGAP